MVAVLTRNTDSGDILGYDLGDKKDKDQMIRVLAYEGVFLDPEDVDRLNQNWTDNTSKKEFKKLSREVANDLSDQFDAQATMSDRIVYATGHASLSLSPVDLERLGKEPYPDMYSEMEHIAREYMKKMDITDTQWVLTFHPGTRCPHMHLAYNRVRNDGTVISAKKERPRSMKACEEITAAHKLATGGEVERNLEALCDKRKVYAQMRLAALDALAESCTFDEFEANLRKKGILLTVTGQGLSYALESGEYYTKGSKLDRNALSYDKVETTLAQNLAARQAQEEAARQKAEAEAKAAEEKAAEEARIAALAAQEAARKAQEEAARAAEEKRRVAERISTQTETFVIHDDMDATLFTNRPFPWPKNMEKLHEAARSILKYHTWGASVRCNEPDEFVEDAVSGQQFGTVKFDMQKARFVGAARSGGMLETPDEVIQFADHKGKALNLFTPEFWDYWHLQLASLKSWLASLSKKTPTVEPVEKAPAPVPQQEPQKQQEAPAPAAKPNPVATPASAPEVAPAPAHQPAAAPVAQVTQPVAQVAQQQTAPTPPPAAKTYEIVLEFKANYYPYRIKKEQDGLLKLQKYEVDKKSPVVDGKHTGHLWYTKEKFTSYEEVGHDANGVYFKIKDTAGKTRFVNQNGIDLDAKKKKQLGLVSKGFGSPTM